MPAIKDIFSSPTKTTTPSSITTPGYNLSSNGTLTRTGVGAGYDNAVSSDLSDLNDLQGDLVPGYGALTAARVGAAQDAGAAATSTLRGDLARRKILGSSFADDAIARSQLETGKQVGEAKAQSFLEEVDAASKIIAQKFSTITGAMQQNLSELGVTSSTVASLNNLGLQAQQLYAQQLGSAAQGLGTIAGLGLSAVSPGGILGGQTQQQQLLSTLLAQYGSTGTGAAAAGTAVPWLNPDTGQFVN